MNCIKFGAEETPPTDWMNGHTAYSFWWILVLYDYYRFTGNREKVGLYVDYLAKLIENTDKLISENGETDFPNYFLDWPTNGTADAVIGCNAPKIDFARAENSGEKGRRTSEIFRQGRLCGEGNREKTRLGESRRT